MKYEAPSHGRVSSGESYEDAAKRETFEELWIELTSMEEISYYYTSFDTNVWLRQHYKKLFVWHTDQEINANKWEIYEVKSFRNIFNFFNFYLENTDLFMTSVKYDIDYLKDHYLS
jgi:8-oxo-dGTP pyrophosphatase MutT (NUDIX family)